MEQLQAYMNSVQHVDVLDYMTDHIDYLGYSLGLYMVFLFWCPPFIKWFLIRFGIFNPSVLNKPTNAMPPLGSRKIALVQLITNLFFCTTAFLSFTGIFIPMYVTWKESGFYEAMCVPQDSLAERGTAIFCMAAAAVLIYADLLYSGQMAAQNIYKQMEVARNRGLPVPAKVTSGVRFVEYVYHAVTISAPWVMFITGFYPVHVANLLGLGSIVVQHALFAIQHVCMIVAPRFAADHEFPFLVGRNIARLFEGIVGMFFMTYTYVAKDCDAVDYTNRISMVYCFFMVFFMYFDLKKMYLTGVNPMLSIYENDQPENRLQKAKQS